MAENQPTRKSPFWFGFHLGLTSPGRLFTNDWPEYDSEEGEEEGEFRPEADEPHPSEK